MLKTLVFDKMLDAEGDEGDIEFDLGDLKSLSLTLKNIALASNLDLDRELKIMTEARKQALEDAANAVEEAAVEKGLDEEQARFWREKVLGVR
jgi:hypothetical protein